jgi:hypothetical protein
MLFTSESVTEGHPDKICDQISDAVLDYCLSQSPLARVACEASVKSDAREDWTAVYGEVTPLPPPSVVDGLVRGVLRDIGYTQRDFGTCSDTVRVEVLLSGQSQDIARGVDHALEAKQGILTDDLDTGAGGPFGDSGLTGRKIIVDTYGGMARHGGGAFRARIRPRSIAPPPTRLATSPSTSWPLAWRAAARSSSPTPSAWRGRSASASRRSAPRRSRPTSSSAPSWRRSISDQPRSSPPSACGSRSSDRQLPTATSDAATWTCPWERIERVEGLRRAVETAARRPVVV